MDRRRVEAFGVLGIPADSDQDAAVHAYRRLALATHPDVSGDPDAAARFATVAAAYQLVSKDPRATAIPVRIHAPAPGDEGWAQASVRVGDASTPGGRQVHRGWTTPISAILGGRRDQRAPIVAGPAWIDPPRRRVDTEVRGG